MELVTKKRLELYSGRSHPELAAEVAEHLGVPLGVPNLKQFSNGEYHCRFGESIRGADVFIMQTHAPTDGLTINDSIVEQCIMIDAAKRASAKRISAVCPYYGYSRQDRKAEGREPITAKLVADMLTAAGADRIISVDLHSGQIQGFFDGPVDHLRAMPVLEGYLLQEGGPEMVIVAPDAGRLKVAERTAQHLGCDLASVYKKRVRGEAEAMGVMGAEVLDGRRCVLIDDMIDTAGTIVSAADILVANGASEVWAMATHAILSGPAVDRLKNSSISRVVVCNTVPIPSEKQFDTLEVLSISQILADAIDAVFEDTSVSEIFGGENQQ